ncbi:required for meiotic nuclear division protein 1, partial [Tremellales sp. Uapishka_1]
MSRPNPGPSRPLGTSPKPVNTVQPGGTTPASVPRRSAGAVPGIARTASTLRQSSPSNPSQSPLASLPHHLRNLSAPRIPSPLGKGTPSRQPKQSLPVRTSKTTEKHVLLPESPQLAPLPKSPIGTPLQLAPPPRSSSYQSSASSSSTLHQARPVHGTQNSFSALQQQADERSDAEKMNKREREENGLPRLTAYATAEGYRLKLLQAFLKREHGVGVVRVFDDCVYNLPLLPGYGASTTIRSSPAVKSPGGVSLLERMTQAEDLGYDDSYFPASDDPDGVPFDPSSEYILSHSPPNPENMMGVMASISHDSDSEGGALGLQSEMEEEAIETGTHSSPDDPTHLEHVPSTALSPSDLPPVAAPPAIPEYIQQHGQPRYPSGHTHHPRPRAKSHSHQTKVAEAVFFSYGVSVFFGFGEQEEKLIMEDCENAGVWLRGQEEDDWEVEEFHYVYDPDAEYPRIYNDMFTFKSHSHLLKLSLAHAIAQSTKLSIYESIMQESLALTSSYPKELSTTGHLQLNRREALKMTGRLFKLRMDVNLIGGILDTPELFWSEASLFPLFEAIRDYLETDPRVQVLNDRLAVVGDLVSWTVSHNKKSPADSKQLEIIHEYIDQRAMHRITWVVIWLIVVACFVEVGEVVARMVFHAIPRDEGEFLIMKGSNSPDAPRALLPDIDEALEGEEPILEGDFTFRAVAVGLLVGVVLCMTNIYFGLQTGWVSMMSLQSALLGFAIFKVFPLIPSMFPNSKPLTVQENVVLQTTAVATGTMPLAAGLVGIIPALGMLDFEQDGRGPVSLGYWSLVMWCLAVAFFGVFLAAPLRRQVIVKEKLVFPSGTATAQLIALLHKAPPPLQSLDTSSSTSRPYQHLPRSPLPTTSEEKDDVMNGHGWWAFGWSFAASGGMTFISFLFPIVFALPVFDILGLPFGTSLAAGWMWWFTPSLSYVGQGIIMGFPVTLSMNAGMIVGWAFLSPLAKHRGWAPGRVSSSTDGARGWILWVALAIMIAESLISLFPIVYKQVGSSVRRYRQSSRPKVFASRETTRDADDDDFDINASDDEEEHEPADRLVPFSWIYWGLGSSAVLGVGLVWKVFGSDGIHPWATAIGLVLASVLSLIGVRSLGETDINPVSGIGKISQLLFAVLQPGNVVANIIAGGVAEAGAQQAGDLMQDLKTGQLLRASPRSQFYGQLIGSLASVFISSAGYKFYTSVYEIPGPQFSVPSAGIWLNLARLLNNGHLPDHVVPFMILFGGLFAFISALKVSQKDLPASIGRLVQYLPSGVAFAIGFLNSPSFSLARLIGGYIAYRSARAAYNKQTPLLVIVVASGFVLGEGVLSILTLGLTSAGYGAISCFGCRIGGGGYCSGGC